MFGKKEKNTNEPEVPITARIEIMPGAFYGGSDPIIYSSSIQKKEQVETPVSAMPPKIAPPPIPVRKPVSSVPSSPPDSVKAPVALQKPPVHPVKQSHTVLIISILVGVLALGFLAYYFLVVRSSQSVVQTPTVSSTVSFVPSVVETVSTTPVIQETPVSTTTPTSTPVVRGGGALVLPHVSYAPALDDDRDSLTNSEEEVFQTDPEVWDTDSDGYYDGREIINLYNPKGIAPQKIIDSGLVREYINPTYQYRFYYPASWRVDSVTNDYKDILVSGTSGDYIEIRIFSKESTLPFSSWFTSVLPDENFSSFSSLENRFQVPFFKHQNNQSAFFETPTAIYSIVYFYGEEEKNAFPHIMEVLLQSFRPTRGGFELPVQPVLPGVVTSTPSVVSSSPVVETTTTSSTLPQVTSL